MKLSGVSKYQMLWRTWPRKVEVIQESNNQNTDTATDKNFGGETPSRQNAPGMGENIDLYV